jgi:hypothetical protein
MPAQKVPLSEKLERIRNSVQKLPAAAASLNSASDELAKSVNELDALLKKFSLGVPTWVPFAYSGVEILPAYRHDDIGYAKIGGKWGLAIQSVRGDERADYDHEEQWLFNDAPRYLRVQGADRLPEVLEALITKAAEMTISITEKANDVRAVTAAMSAVLKDAASKRGTNVGEMMMKVAPAMVKSPEGK